MALNPKQHQFVLEYLKDLNATQAAIRTGYSEHTANRQGARLLADPEVRAALDAAKRERQEATKVDAGLVLTRLAEMMDADPVDIIAPDGSLQPIHEWPLVWRRMLNGFDVEELYAGRGADRQQIGDLKKIRWLDRGRILELLGKHIDVGAFREKLELSGTLALHRMSDEELEGEIATLAAMLADQQTPDDGSDLV